MSAELLGFIALGLAAGTASGFFGIGGGAIIVPVLTLCFKVPYPVAVGTSLALIIPISFAGSAANFKQGTIDWRIFTACVAAGVIGALLGTFLLQRVPVLWARRAFALLLVYTAWRMWSKG